MKLAGWGSRLLRYDSTMPPYWKNQRRSNAPEIIVLILVTICALVWIAQSSATSIAIERFQIN
jgi:hypothetical protein